MMASYYHELLARESNRLERRNKRMKERRRSQLLDDLELDEIQYRQLKELLAKQPRGNQAFFANLSQGTGPPPA